MSSLRIVAATGMLGSGFREESIAAAVAAGARLVGCDAGTTDGGPSYLATGAAAFSAAAVGRDVHLMLKHGLPAGVPVVIGSAGMSGSDAGVDWVAGLVRDQLRALGLSARLARIYAELPAARLHPYLDGGRTAPLKPAGPLSAATVDEAVRIVAVMGAEPFQAALRQGAQVIVAGRSTDAAIFAALPLMEGFDPGPAWHMGKILECGAAAVERRSAPDCMLGTIDAGGFTIEPLRPDYRCTPQSVASHALYETADPLVVVEPSGTLYLDQSRYVAVSDRAVRVEGSRFAPAALYSNKIEGVRQAGFSSIALGAVRDPYILAELDGWLAALDGLVATRLADTIGSRRCEIITRVYGRDGAMGALEPTPVVGGHEVAILWDVVAETQSLAESVATSLLHLALHNPIAKWSGLITGLALPFSPGHLNRGAVYEYHLNHVIFPDSPTELFRTEIEDV